MQLPRGLEGGLGRKRLAGWCAAALAVLPAAAGAAERADELDRWVPAFALSLGVLTQSAEGAVTSGDVLGPPLTTTDEFGTGCAVTNPNTGQTTRNGGLCPGSPLELAPDTTSSDTSVAPLLGGSLELTSPRLVEGALSPRLFVHADLSLAFAFERNLAGERRPARFVPPDLPPTQSNIAEIAIAGQGTRAKSQVRPLVVSAGAGLVFQTEIYHRAVRIKPSFEYLRQEVDLKGQLRRAVKQRSPADSLGTLDDFRLIALGATDTQVQHGLGGGLEIEGDSGRIGPFVLSLFALARGYHFIGNLDTSLSDTNEFGETATWDFALDSWGWRAGLGIRFRWLPE